MVNRRSNELWVLEAIARTERAIKRFLEYEGESTANPCSVCRCVKNCYGIINSGKPFHEKWLGYCQTRRNEWCPARTKCKQFVKILHKDARTTDESYEATMKRTVKRLRIHLASLKKLLGDK